VDVASRQHDLDVRGKQARSRLSAVRLVDGEPDRRRRRFGLALDQPQEREAGLRLSAIPGGLAVRFVSL